MGIISWAIILIAGQSIFNYVERQLSAVIYKYLELFLMAFSVTLFTALFDQYIFN